MGRLTEDMARLRQEIDSGHDIRSVQRRARTKEIREHLNATRMHRGSTSIADADSRARFVKKNSEYISSFLAEVTKLQAANARFDAKARAEFTSELVRSTNQHLREFRDQFETNSRNASRVRNQFVDALGKNVSATIDRNRSSRLLTAKADSQGRAHFVRSLGEEVSNTLATNREEHAKASQKQGADLLAFVSGLTKGVSSLIGAYSEDREGARRAFFSPSVEVVAKSKGSSSVLGASAPVAGVETTQVTESGSAEVGGHARTSLFDTSSFLGGSGGNKSNATSEGKGSRKK